MRSLVSLRAAAPAIARSVVGLGLLAAVSYGCGVDNSGLGETSTKLSRDAGGLGGSVSPAGAGGDTAAGGAGGVIGAGGGAASGGINGAGGTLGAGGSLAVGGAPGTGGDAAGGAPGKGGSGGASGSGVAGGSGGATALGGSGGGGGSAGMSGSGGGAATGGTIGTGGVAGAPAMGGATGTGGIVGSGGTTGTGGSVGTGGATGGSSGTGGLGGATGTGGTGGIPCGPANCTGCCASNGQCIRNVTAQQCGTKGAACVACGGCQICSTGTFGGGGSPGTCAIDPTSQWTIVAVSAQVAMSPSGGGTWDPLTGDEGGSAPDPFCEYENPANDVSATTAGVTDTITDTYKPMWDQLITPANVTVSASALMASKPAWRIWVGDEDCTNPRNCGTLGQIAC